MKSLFLIPVIFFSFIGCDDAEPKAGEYEIISGVSKLPELICYDLEGKEEKIIHRPGEILLLNVWGIHCGPCIEEIPGLNRLVEKYKENNKIRFMALTGYSTDREDLESFLKEHKFDFAQRRIKEKYKKILNIDRIPTTIICNQKGIITYYIQGGGPTTYKYIDRIIQTLLSGGILTL